MEEHTMTSRHGHIRYQATRSSSQLWLPTLVGVVVANGFNACATIPSKFVRQAEPGVTLTALTSHPDAYKGKVVILGGVVIDQKQGEDRIWLRVKNRPLDADYIPHMPVSSEGPEAGHYWVKVLAKDLPKGYRDWSRLIVVGQVSDEVPAHQEASEGVEPVLAALYLRGWGSGWGGYGLFEDTWEDKRDARYLLSTPKPLQKNN
ncbi:MAG: hypothetical protein E6K63_01045 [Nitrospirae bacterium]|nr:MAG: hypothetical protein E6K63_01045 [Nitrospirota bacterium]